MQTSGVNPFGSFRTVKYRDATGSRETEDKVTVEEPLEIRLHSKDSEPVTVSIIMRTPVMDNYLAVGFLFSEGIIKDYADILSIDNIDRSTGTAVGNVISLRVSESVKFDKSAYTRNFAVNSSCGVCGKSNINDVFIRSGRLVRTEKTIHRDTVLGLPEKMAGLQKIFAETGGIHAAGLFTFDGAPVFIAEDIGRHNAVDKVVGYMVEQGLTFHDNLILQVSGRAGFEILQKAAMAGIPVVSSVSAPSSLAIETADSMNMTLVCFVRKGRFNVYTHPERIRM